MTYQAQHSPLPLHVLLEFHGTMPRSMRWLHITLEVIGVMTVLVGTGALLVWLALIRPMRNFAGGNCTDTEQKLLKSSDGKRSVKSFHRVCGSDGKELYSGYSVFLSTGNPNPGYEYTPIAGIRNVGTNAVSVSWDGPDQIAVRYPSTGKLEDVYATVLGVRVVMEPQQWRK